MKKEDRDWGWGAEREKNVTRERERNLDSDKHGKCIYTVTGTQMHTHVMIISDYLACCRLTTHETLPWLVIAMHVLVCMCPDGADQQSLPA